MLIPMKILLKLNEEQQGLKLIQVNDGFVVVDLNKKYTDIPDKNWLINLKSKDFQPFLKDFKYDSNDVWYKQILFATPNLNLEGVPAIEENFSWIENLCSENLKEIESSRMRRIYKAGLKRGYKQAQQNLFTEEEIVKAINLASGERLIDPEAQVSLILHYIRNIRIPKVEITFEDGKPVKCVML